MSGRAHRHGGFTLLELLVVVAVIALLLAILLPALSAASEMGRAAVCAANETQLLQGSIVYQDEHDGWMPWYAFPNDRPEGQEWWVTQVARGMKTFEPKSYFCPSDPVPFPVPVYTYGGMVYMNDGRKYSMGMGGAPNDVPLRSEHAEGICLWLQVTYRGFCSHTISLGGWNTGPDGVRRVTEYAHPEKAIIFFEGVQWMQEAGAPVRDNLCAWNVESIVLTGNRHKIYPSWLRHFGTTNVGFMDGHVEQMEPLAMARLSLAWQDQLVPTFKDRWRRGPDLNPPPSGW